MINPSGFTGMEFKAKHNHGDLLCAGIGKKL